MATAGTSNPTTHKEKHGAEADVLNGAHGPHMNLCKTEAGSVTGAELHAHVLSAGLQAPKVYLGLIQEGGKHKIRAVHRPTICARDPITPSTWDGRSFAFVGDVLPGDFINLVDFPSDAFTACDPQRVPTLAQAQ